MALLDDVLDDFLAERATLAARQAIFAAAHDGRCFQGLPTHANIPNDGNLSIPDRLATRPHYQAETWVDFWPLFPATLRFQLRIDGYEAPDGQFGYYAVLRVREGAVTWTRYIGFGSQAEMFTTDWQR